MCIYLQGGAGIEKKDPGSIFLLWCGTSSQHYFMTAANLRSKNKKIMWCSLLAVETSCVLTYNIASNTPR